MSAPASISHDVVTVLQRLPATLNLRPHPAPGYTGTDLQDGFALELAQACASVFAAMNSTPSILASIICAIALPPPPPTPMTLIIAFGVKFSTNSNIFLLLSLADIPVA
jgi:hypothetical protein